MPRPTHTPGVSWYSTSESRFTLTPVVLANDVTSATPVFSTTYFFGCDRTVGFQDEKTTWCAVPRPARLHAFALSGGARSTMGRLSMLQGQAYPAARSEERRVGKGGSARG